MTKKETVSTKLTRTELDAFYRASEYYARKESSNIKALHYSDKTRVLVVEFSSGSIYRYTGVDPKKFEEAKAAESVTKYLREHIFSDPKCPTEAIQVVVDGVVY